MKMRFGFVAALLFLPSAASAQPYVYAATAGQSTDVNDSSGGGLWKITFDSRIAVIDAASGTVISSFAPAPGRDVAAVTFNPDGSRLFALSMLFGQARVLAVDPNTKSIVASADVGRADTLHLTPNGSTLLLTDRIGNRVLFVDAATLAVKREVSVARANDSAANADGSRVYILSDVAGAATLVVIDTASGNTTATLPLPAFPTRIAIARNAARGIITLGNGLAVILDTAANTVSSTIQVATASASGVLGVGRPSIDSAGARAYIPVYDGASTGTMIVDVAAQRVTGTLAGTSPSASTIGLQNDRLYVGDNEPFSPKSPVKISTFDTNSGALVQSVTIAGSVIDVAVAPLGVTPPADACSYAVAREIPLFISPIQHPLSDPSGSTGRIGVTALPDRCPWTGSTDVPWIALDPGSGVGVSGVGYTIQRNATGVRRTGHITIAGQTITVDQAACSDPIVVIDTPRNGSTVSQPFHVGGWAIDRCSLSDTGVGGMFVADRLAGGYGTARPDVAAIFGPQFLNSGFDALVGREGTGGPRQILVSFGLNNVVDPLSGTVNITVRDTGRPFGVIDTPGEGASVAGEMALTGWALDDIGVRSVRVFRDALPGEPARPDGRVLIGDATRVTGARPDVAAAFPDVNENTRGGFGLMVLTNVLPNGGNGTFRFTVDIGDALGTTTIGPRTVVANNSGSQVPFGTIDTPAQGAVVSGTVINFGWALAPGGNVIPIDGSTIDVVVDGIVVGHPVYNQFRGDVASAFPGYANSGGAVGYFMLDTRTLANGVHTIGWLVRDAAGHAAGIGSRFFTVANP